MLVPANRISNLKISFSVVDSVCAFRGCVQCAVQLQTEGTRFPYADFAVIVLQIFYVCQLLLNTVKHTQTHAHTHTCTPDLRCCKCE